MHASTFTHERFTGWDTTILTCHDTLVVQRHATSPEYRARLVHAERILRHVDHPCAEHLIGLVDEPDSTMLLTRYSGGRTLTGTAHSVDATRTAAAVFMTLGDLHDRGITHGPIRSDQLRLRGEVPVLCGFDDGTLRTDTDKATWRVRCRVDVVSAARVFEGLDLTGRQRRFRRTIQSIISGEIPDARTAGDTLRRLIVRRATASRHHPSG